jgi:ankyrin repeat protein
MLLKAGADPNGVRDYAAFHKSPYQFGVEPSWPINLAAAGGRAEIIRLLLRAGAKPHAPEDEGQTALTIAAERGHLEVVRLLLQAGADRTYRGPGPGGFVGTAEEIAHRSGHQEVADEIRRFPDK